MPVCFLQLVRKEYPVKVARTLEKREKQKKKIIPFRQKQLESIIPFPEPIQFFVLGASISYGNPSPPPPRKKGGGRINQSRDSSKIKWTWSGRILFLTASQTRFAQGELISGSAAI